MKPDCWKLRDAAEPTVHKQRTIDSLLTKPPPNFNFSAVRTPLAPECKGTSTDSTRKSCRIT